MAQKYRVQPPLSPRRKQIDLGATESSQREAVYLGRLAEIGPPRPVWLDISREHVLSIVGKRGSGKSFSLGSLLEGFCTHERSTSISEITKERSVLLFDTLNIFQWTGAPVRSDQGSRHVDDQARQLKTWGIAPVELDVDLWVPAGFESRVTPAARPFRVRTSDMEAADWAALIGVDAVRDPMGQLISQVHDKVAVKGWTDGDGNHVPPKGGYELDDLLACLRTDPEILDDYARETIRAVRQRLSAYEASPLFGAAGTSLTELLRPGRLSILLLSGVPDDVRLVSIFLTIRKLLFARAQASEAAKTLELGFAGSATERERVERVLSEAPPKTWVVIDEAQNIFPSERQTAASEILLRFVREGRNFGLSLAFTTQQPSAIDSRITAQVDTLIAHTLTVKKDLDNVLSNLKGREPSRIQLQGAALSLGDSIRQLQVGQAFVSQVDAERSMFVEIRPRTSIHGGFEG